MRRSRPSTPQYLLALALAASLSLPSLRAQQPSAPPPRPKLVVVIVVDQMRADYIERFRGRWRSGLRRLVDQGAWLRNAAYPYTATETCPGHATISTGVFPATHGIVGNVWWERQSSARVTCTEDESTRGVGLETTTAPGHSVTRLRAPTFAGQLRAAIAGSRVVTLSLKARAAIVLAGPQADAVLWQNETTGEWLTSTAYGREFPSFARRFVGAHPLSAEASKVWNLARPPGDYTGGRSTDGQSSPPGWNDKFPHALAPGRSGSSGAFYQRWRASPFADAYLARLAAAAVDEMKLGTGSGLDFLGIGFSATDYVGHHFGPDSREVEDNLLVLDQTIGALLDHFDRAVGAGRYAVALTADHGVAPVPEQAELQGRDAGRVSMRDVVARVENVLAQRWGAGQRVAQAIGSNLYLAPDITKRLDADADVWRAVEQAILAVPGVQRVARRWGSRAQPRGLDRAVALDTFPGRGADLFIALKANWIFSGRTATGWAGGTTHGTAQDYDQRVPIMLWGAGIKPGQYTVSATPADIAPTLAALCGIRIARTDGRVLTEALAIRTGVPARQAR